jgi:4-amino-4-deoxy-L-arabinose transferase-like glycosyltransferase
MKESSYLFNRQNIILFFLVAFLLVAGFWRLAYSPATWFDEGINVGIARSLVENGVYSLQTGPNEFVQERPFLITNNYPVLLPVAISLKVFGFNFWAARLPMVLFLFLFFAVAYRLVKKLYSGEAAIWALALIASFMPFYGNGKAVLGEVPGLFYFLAGLLVLMEAASWQRLTLAGLFLGLSAATKPFFLLILPAILIGEILVYWKFGKELWRRILFMGLGVFLPLAVWLWTILPQFSFAGIVATVNYYSNSYATSDFWPLIASNFLRFFTESTPAHLALLWAAAVFGIWQLRRKGGNLRETEVILLAFIFLNILWYLKTPGWYRYFFPAHLLLLLMFPAFLPQAVGKRIAILVLSALFILQAALLAVKINEPLYYSRETADFTEAVKKEVSPDSSILFINSPSAAFLASNRKVYQYLQINPKLFFGRNELVDLSKQPYDYLAINSPAENVLIPDLNNSLAVNYQKLLEIGHFSLYKKK